MILYRNFLVLSATGSIFFNEIVQFFNYAIDCYELLGSSGSLEKKLICIETFFLF